MTSDSSYVLIHCAWGTVLRYFSIRVVFMQACPALSSSQCLLPPPTWRWRHKGHPKRRYPTATLHGITTQKTSSWIFQRRENLRSRFSIPSWHVSFKSRHVGMTHRSCASLSYVCTRHASPPPPTCLLESRSADRLHCGLGSSGTLQNGATPWKRVLLEKLTVAELVKKFPAFCGTWRFIAVFIKPWSQSFLFCFPKNHCSIFLPSTSMSSKWSLLFMLPSWYIAWSPNVSHVCYMAHLILLDLITLITRCEEYTLRSSSLCNFLSSPDTSS
jgi:hypothetical protein